MNCLKEDIYPNKWNKANVVQIHKKCETNTFVTQLVSFLHKSLMH